MRVSVIVISNMAVVEAQEGIETPVQWSVLGCVVPHVPFSNQLRGVPQSS